MSPPVSPTVSTTDVVNGDAPNPSANGTGVGKRYRTQPAKTFQCRGYGDCRMVFSRSEHLARHVRKHTGERPFTCHCSKQFSRLDNLRQHAQTVHADKQEQNETLMRDLTSLHTAMAVGKGRKRTSASSSSVNINANTSPVSQPTSPTVQGTGRTDVKLESEHPPHNRNLEYPGLATYNGHINIPNAHTGGVARPGTTAGYEASSYYSQTQPSRSFRTSSDDSISSQSQSFQQQQQQTNHSFPSPISPPPHSSQRYTTHGQSFQNSHSFSHLHQQHAHHPHAHTQDSFRAESPSSNSVVSPLSALPALPTPPPPAPNNSSAQHSFPGAVAGPGSRGSPSGESNSGGSAGNGGGGGYTPVPSPHGGVGQTGQSFRPHPFEHAAYNPLAHSHHSGGSHSFRGHGHGHEGDSHSFLGSGNGSPGRTLPSFTTLVSSGASNAYSHSLGGGSGEGSGEFHLPYPLVF